MVLLPLETEILDKEVKRGNTILYGGRSVQGYGLSISGGAGETVEVKTVVQVEDQEPQVVTNLYTKGDGAVPRS